MKLPQFPLDGCGGCLLLRRSYETDQYSGQFPLDGCGGFSAAEALTIYCRNLIAGFSLRDLLGWASDARELKSTVNTWTKLIACFLSGCCPVRPELVEGICVLRQAQGERCITCANNFVRLLIGGPGSLFGRSGTPLTTLPASAQRRDACLIRRRRMRHASPTAPRPSILLT